MDLILWTPPETQGYSVPHTILFTTHMGHKLQEMTPTLCTHLSGSRYTPWQCWMVGEQGIIPYRWPSWPQRNMLLLTFCGSLEMPPLWELSLNLVQKGGSDLTEHTTVCLKTGVYTGCVSLGGGGWGVSMLYKLLTSPPTNLSHQVAWEGNLGIAPGAENWRKWSLQIHKGTLNVALI